MKKVILAKLDMFVGIVNMSNMTCDLGFTGATEIVESIIGFVLPSHCRNPS